MIAYDMFKKLGFFANYDYGKNDKELCFYSVKEYGKMILFNKINKTIWISPNFGEISLEELKAINKQIEELEWR